MTIKSHTSYIRENAKREVIFRKQQAYVMTFQGYNYYYRYSAAHF